MASFLPKTLSWSVDESGMTVEDIAVAAAPPGLSEFQGLSHSPKKSGPSSGSAPQTERLCLTPRTSEACLMEGINPLDLFSRELVSFTYGGVDRAVATVRAAAYDRLRAEKFSLVRAARIALSEGRLPASFGGGKAPPPISSPRGSLAGGSAKRDGRPLRKGEGEGTTMLGMSSAMEAEAERLARIQKRQQRELAQLIAGEMRQAESRKAADEKASMDDSRAHEHSQMLAAKKAAAIEEARMRELKRQIAEQEEMARNVRTV
jgi:hypothetical protein